MLSPIQIEEAYKGFMVDFPKSAHDGIIFINLQFLYDSGLLNSIQDDQDDRENVTQYFHVVESPEKVTLFNEQFVIWIIPRVEKEIPMTYVLIALNHQDMLHLEIVFMSTGVYNTPRHVLKILQHFLLDVQETEAALLLMEKSQ